MAIDPGGLPKYILIGFGAFGILYAVNEGMLARSYSPFGFSVATTEVAWGMFAFAALIALIAYARWV
jgi:hypothetical protein